MGSDHPEVLEHENSETLDARVFNPAREPEDHEPSSVETPAPATTDPLEEPPQIHRPQILSLPKTPVVPHFTSKYALTYDLEKFSENRMIIFNHDKFKSGPERSGTLKDEDYLRKTLGKFRFTIDPTHKNLKKTALISTVKDFALKTNFCKYGCILVVIMTHGYTKKPGYLMAYDAPYNEHEIFEHFDASKNSSLAGKPIVFLFQACRGSEPSSKVETRRYISSMAQLDDDEDREFYNLPMDSDRIVFHSSYVGRASVRHPQRGSWFIQTLCKKIDELALTHDLETIFRMVRREVALDFETAKDWKQMPVVSTTTIREIRLAPSSTLPVRDNSIDMVDMPVRMTNLSLTATPGNSSRDEKVTTDAKPFGGVETPMTPVLPVYKPCSCYLDYFNYLRTCLRSFVQHNAEDGVAVSLLTMAERAEDGVEYNVLKFSLIQSIWEHFEANLYRFPPDGSVFVYRLFH